MCRTCTYLSRVCDSTGSTRRENASWARLRIRGDRERSEWARQRAQARRRDVSLEPASPSLDVHIIVEAHTQVLANPGKEMCLLAYHTTANQDPLRRHRQNQIVRQLCQRVRHRAPYGTVGRQVRGRCAAARFDRRP